MRTETARMAAAVWTQKPLISTQQMSLNKSMEDMAPVGVPPPPPPPPPEEGRALVIDVMA